MPEPLILGDLTNVTINVDDTRTYAEILGEAINANAIKLRTGAVGYIDGGTTAGTIDFHYETPRYELTDLIRRIEELEQKYETLSAEFFRFKYDKLTPVELDELMAMVNGGA